MSKKKIVFIIFGIVILIGIIGSVGSGSKKIGTVQQTASPTPEAVSEEYKNSVAKKFCDNRSDGVPHFDIDKFIDYIEGKVSGNDTLPNTKKNPTIEACKKITDYCLSLFSRENCEDIADEKIWIGMYEVQLNLSWGLPDDINNTTNTFGISSQWVYGNPIYKANYVYLEGQDKSSMKVTSWQD